MSRVLAASGVVLRPDGRVLLIRRKSPPLAGTWSLPGGKVLPGESIDAAVVREVLEETGLTVQPRGLVEVVLLEGDGNVYEIHEVACEVADDDTGKLRPGDDASDARWAHEEEFDALALTDEVRAVIKRARGHSCAPAAALRSS